MPLAERNGLVLDYLNASEAAEIGPLMLKSFHVYEFMRHMMPDTPAMREGWTQITLAALNDKKHTISLKVTDSAADNKIIAHGRWTLPKLPGEMHHPGEEDGRWDEFVAACDETLANRMFGSFAEHRTALMGDQPHYFMELLAVDGAYKGKGAGSMIMKHGLALADRDGTSCYVDGSPEGWPLYEKLGFELKATVSFDYDITYFYGVRPPQGAQN